ncbi:YlbF family regulator [Pseudogracilibacillus auburnensis]|uniref:YlbF family regulator n=1 Tax=Pseudogracilibacillus auburnensis TaxID=1494959 RepID=UPI001A966F4F|nr:YlbF family regulator [Pseudogracilibacillus auburnensis]MBO1003537.1 YlbF family regulator [Pseudogracilibacillus auburnensis]
MIANLEYVAILDKTDELTKMILQSDIMIEYQRTYHLLQTNEEAQRLIQTFLHIKDHYEDVERFGRYHPDYHEIMRDVRSAKRKMDMNSYVAAFKVAERNVQRFLDEISENIAKSVSDHIMVPKEGLALIESGCASGSCGTGGKCGCQAS